MEEKEFYTVAEFAEKVGITTQAVYQRLQGELGKHCKVESGRKMISAEALELFFIEKERQKEEITTENQPAISNTQEEMLAMLKQENERLAKENCKLVEMLQVERNLVQEKDEMIASLTKRLADMVNDSNKIAKQALEAVEKAQVLQAASEKLIETARNSNDYLEQDLAKKEKRGLFGWMKKRR